MKDLINEYERRLRNVMSSRIHMPVKDLKLLIEKIRAGDELSDRIKVEGGHGYAVHDLQRIYESIGVRNEAAAK